MVVPAGDFRVFIYPLKGYPGVLVSVTDRRTWRYRPFSAALLMAVQPDRPLALVRGGDVTDVRFASRFFPYGPGTRDDDAEHIRRDCQQD